MDCTPIKEIRGGMKNITVFFIVLENIACSKTKENREVNSFKVADITASINCSIWDEPGKLLVPGDIVKLTKGYASIFRGCLTLYSGKSGEIIKMGDFCMVFNEQINMSDPIPQQSQPQAIQGNHVNANSNTNSSNGNGNRPTVVVNPPTVTPVVPANATNSSSTSNQSSKPTKTTPPSKGYMRKPISKK
ncbi:SOSS complex subunit B homolog [Chironomus tepperi]|uniref:SOSS complex subunit B homolog n=1 Tax=Chironomus tepperi TaxID=113505 RepID=UPI00391F39F5